MNHLLPSSSGARPPSLPPSIKSNQIISLDFMPSSHWSWETWMNYQGQPGGWPLSTHRPPTVHPSLPMSILETGKCLDSFSFAYDPATLTLTSTHLQGHFAVPRDPSKCPRILQDLLKGPRIFQDLFGIPEIVPGSCRISQALSKSPRILV